MINAVIGIGSNSTRLLVSKIDDGKIENILRLREDTRLIESMQNGALTDAAILRAVDAIARLVTRARGEGAENLRIIATCATREAENSDTLCRLTEEVSGTAVEILSGEEEARLSFIGGTGSGAASIGYCGMIDLGGGSMELAVGGGGQPLEAASVPLGARRLALQVPELLGDGFARALGIAMERAAELSRCVTNGRMPAAMVAVGGTMTCLASMDLSLPRFDPAAVEGHVLTRDAVDAWARKLSAMTEAERAAIPGIHPHRADIIAHGAVALLGVMRALSIPRIVVSARTNLDGCMRELAEAQQASDPTQAVRQFYDASVEREWERLSKGYFEFEINKRYMDRYIRSGDRVLDVGGGPGRYSFHLASRGADVTLVDLSPENIAFAREKAKELKLTVETHCADARELPAACEGMYDAILLMGPLYHLLTERDRAKAVRECLVRLKPGGLLFAAFISTAAGMIFAGRDMPESILWENEDAFYETIIAGKDFAGAAFTQAFFAERRNILPFMEGFPLETLHLVGSEGVTAPFQNKLMEQPQEVIGKWLALSLALCENEAFYPYAEHFLYVGRKRELNKGEKV